MSKKLKIHSAFSTLRTLATTLLLYLGLKVLLSREPLTHTKARTLPLTKALNNAMVGAPSFPKQSTCVNCVKANGFSRIYLGQYALRLTTTDLRLPTTDFKANELLSCVFNILVN